MVNRNPRPVADFMPVSRARGQALTILRTLRTMSDGATRNEISRATRLPIQSVCARVGWLLELGEIYRAGLRPCTVSGHANEVLRVTPTRGQSRLDNYALEEE